MKYLFINSVCGVGSTGRIVAEKCRELMAQGHECRVAFGRKEANSQDLSVIRIGTSKDYCLHAVQSRIFDNHGFGSQRATMQLLEQIRAYDPDVIWLHNLHGYYIHIGLLFGYLKTCGKEIRWTLHDCWAFTGHCAYFDYVNCQRWRSGCYDCPQKKTYPASFLMDRSSCNYEQKRELFTGIPNLTLITPSVWMRDLVKESFLKEYPVEVCCNTVDTDIFHPVQSNFRGQHNLEQKKILLGVASVWEPRKGLEDFVKLSGELDGRYQVVLVGVTEAQAKKLPRNILTILRTNSPTELAQIYSAADVFVNPTYEDNYPTVNLEAQACGIPVVCYDTGGSSETLKAGSVLVPKGDLQAMKEAICRMTDGGENR